MDLHAIITHAWADAAFKQELLTNPRAVLERELGLQLPDGIEIFIHEQTPTQLHLLLPMPPAVEETSTENAP
jgi:hypothetical protein